MKISTRGRYACRALIVLAKEYGKDSVSIDKIAANQRISKRYLEHIFTKLRRAGIITGSRGSRGGYKLLCPPNEITVGQVLRAVEGPLGPVRCVYEPSSCNKAKMCATHNFWCEVADAINKFLDSKTIGALASEQLSIECKCGCQNE